MICIVVELSTGNIIRSDGTDETTREEAESGIATLMSQWSRLDKVSVLRGGHNVFINPAHVVAFWVEDVEAAEC